MACILLCTCTYVYMQAERIIMFTTLDTQAQKKAKRSSIKPTFSVGHYVGSSISPKRRKGDHQAIEDQELMSVMRNVSVTQSSANAPYAGTTVQSEPYPSSLMSSEGTSALVSAEIAVTSLQNGGQQDLLSSTFSARKRLPAWITQSKLVEEDVISFSRPVSDVSVPNIVVRNLARVGVDQLFPVQAHVIPELLSSVHSDFPRDIVVCAPTGCGKTLAYVVPIVSALMNRVMCQVYALVVVPSQELASQVNQVFKSIMAGTSLKTGLLSDDTVLQDKLSYPPCSSVDVLVSTPGKLMEHFNRSSFATLASLRYLVLDEADKLLKQSSSLWLSHLLARITADNATTPYQKHSLKAMLTGLCVNAQELMLLQAAECEEDYYSPQTVHPPMRKLLLSATMTFDPTLLAALELCRPLLFSVPSAQLSRESDLAFTIPQKLKEVMVRCALEEKPLALVHLVRKEVATGGRVLCFANSRETAHRLFLLLREMDVVRVDEVSSSVSQGRRREALSKLKNGQTQALVCSDHMARGMDVERVSCVINYESPRQFQTYLHRAGRTARAGKEGVVYTLLSGDEVHCFKTMMRLAHRRAVEEGTLTQDDFHSCREQYSSALERLQLSS